MDMKRAIILIVILLLPLNLASCGSFSKKAVAGRVDRSSIAAAVPDTIQKWIDSGRYDDSIIDILNSSAVRNCPPGSTDLIEAALAEGKIDRATKAQLMIQAAFDPQNLPQEYAGPVYTDGTDWLTSDLQWLILHHD